MRHRKADSRERWRQVRSLWNAWDPIGVADEVQDEYDAYLGPTLRLLEQGESLDEIERYLTAVTLEHMGLSDTAAARMGRRQFAMQLRDWYGKNWPGSTV